NDDVGHFEIHHIDKNTSNNQLPNLLLLCPLCHSKIEKDDISHNEVVKIKARLVAGIKNKIKLTSINIDSKNCSWVAHEEIDNVFFDKESVKSPFPILDFNFINHSDKTITLKAIRIKKKSLSSGISGLMCEPRMVKLLTKYKIQLKGENTKYKVMETFQVPTKQAFRFQAELFEGDAKYPTSIEGRNILHFSFEFSDEITVNSPSVYFNFIDEYKDGYTISAIGFGANMIF
ncbi:MAG TPA: hypothetical protein VNW06_05195, partial [Cytophagaceae bacterium]|nr:hypothetical protein [Cytophagaceae bacterium]